MRRRFLGLLAGGIVVATFGPALQALSAGTGSEPGNSRPGSGKRVRRVARKDKLALVPFQHSPFPYDGIVPELDTPFLDVSDGLRRGHKAPRGGVYWEDPTYRDRRSLLFVPGTFDARKPGFLVVYFHGNNATLERDVRDRQQVPQQLLASGINAVLAAPQFALDANDSSAGHFWRPGGFARYLEEVHTKLAGLYGSRATGATFARLPVLLVAYSGGYHPAAWSLTVGDVGRRMRGVILLDAIYGDVEKFSDWIIAHRKHSFFFSAYSVSGHNGNIELIDRLRSAGVAVTTSMPAAPRPGRVAIVDAGSGATHDDFLTRAWVDQPLAWLLARIR